MTVLSKRQRLEEAIETLDSRYQEHGIDAIREHSYPELGLLLVRKQDELKQVGRRLKTPGEPNPVDVRLAEQLERQRAEILRAFYVRARETTERGISEPELQEPEIGRE